MVKCDRCNGDTREVKRHSKKTGKELIFYQCVGDCKDGVYSYSMPSWKVDQPPGLTMAEQYPGPTRAQANSTNSTVEMIRILMNIELNTKNILEFLKGNKNVGSKNIPIKQSEMQADEDYQPPTEAPF